MAMAGVAIASAAVEGEAIAASAETTADAVMWGIADMVR
jgi:hypothetical protein